MTIGELKRGMKVTLRDGSKCIVSNSLVDVNDGSWEEIESYNENMTNKYTDELDIIEVVDCNGNLIFAEEVMTKAEAEAKFGIRIRD